MGLLSQVKKGRSQDPPRILIYGKEGIGKSTWASQAPAPIFVPTEDGLGSIDCHRLPIRRTWAEAEAALQALLDEDHEYGTVVVDSTSSLEKLIWQHACREANVDCIERIDGGYGKGYTYVLKFWWRLVQLLDRLRDERGMCSVLVAHHKVEKFEDPTAPSYSQYQPRLHKVAQAVLVEWADAVLFATQPVRTSKEDAGFNKSRNIAAAIKHKDHGDRILRANPGPECVAKNRYSVKGDIPLSWDAFMAAMADANPEPVTTEATDKKGAA